MVESLLIYFGEQYSCQAGDRLTPPPDSLGGTCKISIDLEELEILGMKGG
jgi:hypothetical protein